jgi:hypothetical protein
MSEAYYIGVYWGARGDSVSACADRLGQMLAELEGCHELLDLWIQSGASFRQARKRKLEPRREVLEPLFDVSIPQDPPSLGYMFSAWNAQLDDAKTMDLLITCGMVPTHSGLCNCVVLNLPEPSDTNATLYEPDVLLCILRAVVRAWDPDWGGIMDFTYIDSYADPDNIKPAGKPSMGWMTYLRNKRLGGLAGAPPCEVEEVPGLGSIFLVTRDHRFSVENPDDLARIQALTDYLEAHGALVPIPTNEPH